MKKPQTSEELQSFADKVKIPPKQGYTPRPKWQTIFALFLAIVVVLAFLGTCYWMIFGRF